MKREEPSSQAHGAQRLHLSPGSYGKKSDHSETSVGALCGLAGLVSLFAGGLTCVVAWLAGGWQWDAWLERLGVGLLVLTVPLLALGAHCFDCVERQPGARPKAKRRGEGN